MNTKASVALAAAATNLGGLAVVGEAPVVAAEVVLVEPMKGFQRQEGKAANKALDLRV